MKKFIILTVINENNPLGQRNSVYVIPEKRFNTLDDFIKDANIYGTSYTVQIVEEITSYTVDIKKPPTNT